MSTEFDKMLVEAVSKRLAHLNWKCTGCPQLSTCDDQPNKGESRYCWPIIVAAIMGEESWKTNHDPEDIHIRHSVLKERGF